MLSEAWHQLQSPSPTVGLPALPHLPSLSQGRKAFQTAIPVWEEQDLWLFRLPGHKCKTSVITKKWVKTMEVWWRGGSWGVADRWLWVTNRVAWQGSWSGFGRIRSLMLSSASAAFVRCDPETHKDDTEANSACLVLILNVKNTAYIARFTLLDVGLASASLLQNWKNCFQL